MSSEQEALYALRWHRIDLILKNTQSSLPSGRVRDALSEETDPKRRLPDPRVIFNGMFMTAAPAKLKPENRPRRFVYRLWGNGEPKLKAGASYRLSWMLAGLDDEEVAATLSRFVASLERFAVEGEPAVRKRSLADLLVECPCPEGAGEVCLDFEAPLKFQPDDPLRDWDLRAASLGKILARQLGRFFGDEVAVDRSWDELRSLPYYWKKKAGAQAVHGRSSGSGVWKEEGYLGPYYLRGPLAGAWPLLLLGQELPCGDGKIGGGGFSLRWSRPVFRNALFNPQSYLDAYGELAERSDQQEEFFNALRDPESSAKDLAQAVKDETWKPGAAQGFWLKKESGGFRLIAQFPPRDALVHKVLHRFLAEAFDHAFEDASVGYRPRLSPAMVQERIRQAYAEGFLWAVRADVEDFFDQVDWDLLESSLRRVLPASEDRLLALIMTVVRSPLAIDGASCPRERGLPQGSPLSPLLANVYLDEFDEEMGRRGLRHLRFADDLLVLCSSEEEANQALGLLREILAPFKLRLNEEKSAVVCADEGFRFLGMDYVAGLSPGLVAAARHKRTLYLRDARCWLGVDHEALIVRAAGQLLSRVPFSHLDGVVLLGAGGLSSLAVQRCNDWKLPVVFCGKDGRGYNVLSPRNRENLDVAVDQRRRHEQLRIERLEIAQAIVEAKIRNHIGGFQKRPEKECKELVRELKGALRSLADLHPVVRARLDERRSTGTQQTGAREVGVAPSDPIEAYVTAGLDYLRGIEGMAAKGVFRCLNDLVPAWYSAKRVQHEQPDPWNSLLDFASHLLFCRLQVLVLQYGLNPWLGFLHSEYNRYESLVYDLMEPFRPRVERFVYLLARKEIVRPDQLLVDPRGGYRLGPEGMDRFVEHWERQLMTTEYGDEAELLTLLEAQVLSIRYWARNGERPTFYRAERRLHRKGETEFIA